MTAPTPPTPPAFSTPLATPPVAPARPPQPPAAPSAPPQPPAPDQAPATPALERHVMRGMDVEIPLQSPTPAGHPAWDAVPEVRPKVPKVDLPAIDVPEEQTWWPDVQAMMCTGTETVRRVVEEYESRPPQRIAVDIETHGLSGPGKWEITCITAAFRLAEGTVYSVLFDPLRNPDDRALWERVRDRATTMVFHNAAFDIPILYAHQLIQFSDIRKVEDTVLLSRQLNTISRGGRSLEDLSGKYGIAEDTNVKILNAFKAQNQTKETGYANSDIHAAFYRRGAMSDTAATLRLWDELYVAVVNLHAIGQPGDAPSMLTLPEAHELVANIQRAGQVTLQMSATGLNWDEDHMNTWLHEQERKVAEATKLIEDAGLDPGNGAQLVNKLNDQGLLPADWPRTDKGALKADKNAMKMLTKQDNPLAKAHTEIAEYGKIWNYMTSTRDTAKATGRVHAGIEILGAHATGRMCLPMDTAVLTKRGVLPVHEVKAGDLTLDAAGRWTPISAVHIFDDADVYAYPTNWRGRTLVATPEHRWVQRTPTGTVVAPLYTGTATVVTTPDPERVRSPHLTEDFPDPASLTKDELHAALLGWAVSTRPTVQYGEDETTMTIGNAGGIGKYLAEMADLLYEGAVDVSYDEVSATLSAGEGAPNRFKVLVAACLAGAADTYPERTVASFDGSCSQVFLQSVVLGGIVDDPSGVHVMVSEPWARAVAMAAHRAGMAAVVGRPDNRAWATVSLLESGDVTVYADSARRLDNQAVYCVTTSSGTFTYFDGTMFSVTGNSVNNPPLQQFSEDARPVIAADGDDGLWSVDWSSIEPVILSNMAGDTDFITPFNNGGDLYIPLARRAGLIPANVSDDDAASHPGRKKAKQMLLACMYGQGMRSLSEGMGISVDEAYQIQAGLRNAMHVTWSFMDSITAGTRRSGFSWTIWGRMMDERLPDEIKTHVAVNHFCQGSAADVLMDTILRLDDAGVGHRMKMLIHDEVVCGEKDVELVKHIMSTPPKALAERAKITPFLRVDAQYMGQHWLKV